MAKKRQRARDREIEDNESKPKLQWLSLLLMRHSPRNLHFLALYGMCKFVHKKTKRLPSKGYTKSHPYASKSTTKKAAVLRRIFFLFFFILFAVFLSRPIQNECLVCSPAIFFQSTIIKAKKNCVDRRKGVVGCCTRRDIQANPFTCSSSCGRIPKRA